MRRLAMISTWVAIGLAIAGPAVAGVSAALVPNPTPVAPDADFTVTLRITQSGALFNSYAAVIGYDPSAITFVQEPPTVQEGALMRNACGNTFQSFHASASQVSIEHSIVCPGLSLSGPGDLYVLHFRAGHAARSTNIHFVSLGFYNGGFTVPVTSSSDGTIRIGSATDVARNFDPDDRPGMTIAPNPFVATTLLRVQTRPSDLQTLRLVDARGRSVRLLEPHPTGRGSAAATWDGRDTRGVRLPAGVYWAMLANDPRAVRHRCVLLH